MDTTGSTVYPTVNAYVGDTLSAAASVNNLFSANGRGGVSAPVTAGTTYHFSVGSNNGAGTLVLNLQFTDSQPVATVVATTPSVTAGSGVGQFTIALSGALATDTFVNYSVKGSAVNGSDYALLKGTVKVKAGKTSKALKVVPDSGLIGGKKIVKFTLLPGTGYTVGAAATAKVKIYGR